MTRALLIALVAAFVLLAAFVTLNWGTMAAPALLDLGFIEVRASPGWVLLAFILAISALFVLYVALLQAGVILEARRLTREVKAQRELADTAEASRFTELRSLLEGEMNRITAQLVESRREFGDRVEGSGLGVRAGLDEATATLSAYLGEIEDKLDRVLASQDIGQRHGD